MPCNQSCIRFSLNIDNYVVWALCLHPITRISIVLRRNPLNARIYSIDFSCETHRSQQHSSRAHYHSPLRVCKHSATNHYKVALHSVIDHYEALQHSPIYHCETATHLRLCYYTPPHQTQNRNTPLSLSKVLPLYFKAYNDTFNTTSQVLTSYQLSSNLR
ncbi:hypothetical protein VNO78_10268 [Psophocarpus tetragonolobus]|uniref:Uncharacterized protein n=1 Tax=Psophocarpus tetragonolobus TaxID=3891 RepID=A0AAN9SKH3_PSOTE